MSAKRKPRSKPTRWQDHAGALAAIDAAILESQFTGLPQVATVPTSRRLHTFERCAKSRGAERTEKRGTWAPPRGKWAIVLRLESTR